MLGLLLLPVVLALIWGVYFADEAYIPLHYAQNLAAGKGLAGFVGDRPPLRSPLWTAVLTLASFVQLPLTYTALILGALGWGVTAVWLYRTAVANKAYFVLAVLPGLLLGLNPVVIRTLGSEFPWLLIAALWAWRQPASLPLLPFIYFDWPMVVVFLALLGGYAWQRKPITPWPIIGWLLSTAGLAGFSWWQFGRMVGEPAAGTALIVAGLLLVMSWGLPGVVRRWQSKVNLPAREAALGLALFIGVPFVLSQGYLLWQGYRLRAPAYQQLQVQIGRWLHEQPLPDRAVFGSAQIGYLAQRPVWPWQGQRGDEARLPDLLPRFVQEPPAFFVSSSSLAWRELTHTGWFQGRYRAAATFQTPYEPRSPFTLWAYEETPFDRSEPQPIEVEAENGLKLMAYQYSPAVITPSEAVYVTLYWQTTRPITTTFSSVVRLISPLDQVAWAQRDLYAPRSIPPAWLKSDDWFAERFVLTTTADIPIGGYELNLSLYNPRATGFINLYQNEDTNVLDRVLLGYVAVPWLGDKGTAHGAEVMFGDQIQLTGYELEGKLKPGDSFTTKLYWEALRPPDENYSVFVHLLDEEGQLVVNHDGVPFYGRYPTRAWQPGTLIFDEHPLTLPPDLASGQYRLTVGLYLLTTGERLPVGEAGETGGTDGAFVIEVIDVP